LVPNILNTIPQIHLYRFLISLLTAVAAAFLTTTRTSSQFLWITLVFLVYNGVLGLQYFLSHRGFISSLSDYLMLAIDVMGVSAAIWLSGGVHSPLFVLYIVLFGLNIYQMSLPKLTYTMVLSLLLYAGVVFWPSPFQMSALNEFLGNIFLMTLLGCVTYYLIIRLLNEKKDKEKFVSRAKTLVHISDILSSSLSTSKEWIRKITTLIDSEVRQEGIKCRIVLHRQDQPFFLPSSGGNTGMQIPIMAGDYIFGTMWVTSERRVPLAPSEQTFFSTIARSLGLAFHRMHMWEDLNNQLKKMETSLFFDSTIEKLPLSQPKLPSI